MNAPRFDVDLFTDEAILDPYGHYAAMRDLGPVVWLEKCEMYALPRYAEVRAALSDDERFISSRGVAFNEVVNEIMHGTTLASNDAAHRRQRTVLNRGLNPHALKDKRELIEQRARELVDVVLEHDVFDAVPAFAQALPLLVVPDLLGWDERVRPQLLGWAEAAFDTIGPLGARNQPKLALLAELAAYATTIVDERRVAPDSVGASVLAAAERGEIEDEGRAGLMLDFLTPSLDTTASALGAAFHLFATHPEQWRELRHNASLIGNAVNEIVRWQSPIRFFTRVTAGPVEIAGVTIPADARVVLMYASANRDERFWDRPDEFDIRRADVGRQVGFGYGVHACAGQGLTRLEGESLLRELMNRVALFEPAGEPRIAVNTIIRAYESVPIRAVPVS
jgi:cytochrome P450